MVVLEDVKQPFSFGTPRMRIVHLSRYYARVALSGAYNRATGFPFHLLVVPGVTNKQNFILDSCNLPLDSCKTNNIPFGLSLPFFSPGQHPPPLPQHLVSVHLPLVRQPRPVTSWRHDIFPREMMSKQEERMVHKKVAFRSSIIPQKINIVVFSHYLASEHSSF